MSLEYLKKNTKAFREISMQLEHEHHGEIALFHDGKLCGIFPDQEKAYFHGEEKYGSGAYCIFPIGRERVFSIGALGFLIDGSNIAAKGTFHENEEAQEREDDISRWSDEASTG